MIWKTEILKKFLEKNFEDKQKFDKKITRTNQILPMMILPKEFAE